MRTNLTLLVHNRPRLTAQTLFTMEVGGDDRLMILDDASDDVTNKVVRSWRDSHGATCGLIRNEISYGTGEARNQVIKHSEFIFGRGTYLYLSDNDVCFTRPDWLDILIRCYERAWHDGFRVIGAYNHPFHLKGKRVYTPDTWAICEVNALALQSMLMRWEVWDKYGPFVTTPVGRVRMSEDVAFTNKLRDDGGRIGVVSPALLVNTGVTDSFGEAIPGVDLVKAEVPQGVIVE